MARRWSEEEKLAVLSGVGTRGWRKLQRVAGDSYDEPHLPPGRSIEAVRRQIRRMCGSGARRGGLSLLELSKATGYHRRQLRRAQRALNQAWTRMSATGAYLISEDQASDIVAWLSHDFWCASKRLYGCVWCSTSKREHHSLGLCARCFHRYRKRCLENGLPASMRGLREMVDRIELDCVNAEVHGKFLEQVKRRLSKGLALTEDLLDWVVMCHERDLSGIDS